MRKTLHLTNYDLIETAESCENAIYEPSMKSYRDSETTTMGADTTRFRKVSLKKDKNGKEALLQYLMKNGINITKNDSREQTKIPRSSVTMIKNLTARQSSTQSVPEDKENVDSNINVPQCEFQNKLKLPRHEVMNNELQKYSGMFKLLNKLNQITRSILKSMQIIRFIRIMLRPAKFYLKEVVQKSKRKQLLQEHDIVLNLKLEIKVG